MSYTEPPLFFSVLPVNIEILNPAPIKPSKQSMHKSSLCPKEFNYKVSLSRHFLNTQEKSILIAINVRRDLIEPNIESP
jgi:hypothetical protein